MTSIDSLARQLMANYDHDRSGAVDLRTETERVEKHDDGGSWSYAKKTARRAFREADAIGNKDGKVTYEELVKLGQRYDTGTAFWLPHTAGDGRLEGLEALRAMGEVGEEFLGFVGASKRDDGGFSALAAGEDGGAFVTAGPQGGIVLGGSKTSNNWFGAIGDALRGAFGWANGARSGSGTWG